MVSLIITGIIILVHALLWSAIWGDHSKMSPKIREWLLSRLRTSGVVSIILLALYWLRLQGFIPSPEDTSKLTLRVCILLLFADTVVVFMARSWLKERFEKVQYEQQSTVYNRNDIWRNRH